MNNGFFSFEYSRDLETLLRKQWAGMFFKFLQNRTLKEQYDSQNKILSNLEVTSNKLEEIVKNIYLQVDKKDAKEIIEEVENKALAEKMFSSIFEWFDADGFYESELESLKEINIEQPWYDFLCDTAEFGLDNDIETGTPFLVMHSMGIGIPFDFNDKKIGTGWEAFKKLNEKQREEVLSKFAVK